MERDRLKEISGDGAIRERVLSREELVSAQNRDRDREYAQREASITARLKFVLQEDSSVVEKSDTSPFQENI